MPSHLILKMKMLKATNNFDQEATLDGIFLVDAVVHEYTTIDR